MSTIREARLLESFVDCEQLGNQTISVRNEMFSNFAGFDRGRGARQISNYQDPE